ncbi:phosphoketolase [Candidatus Kaiserbacteria bacterium RIFCSPLOWO2_02_FULL_45_11b]|uniref:Phosphoketolase n=1 Tax=Candidatus Kaiserbacteria bacterium RIFCSPLOWO2_12_FULL_45_26 TaxID=1798525 RepID=A0A1F6FFX0_9BACT|nr:MAG: phosphoketolase [Candidatus Kaiserbacteria bacterium RIFCSPLOWO2_01_FULL_45_25]OGG80995.1 MAG: phosphoketolase [Candidatus Kaiserbacteria bacterium RIFCSPLOWO2_02_FULL_45_11b]OGG84737.1 MAG: phosphoketolase [Candidatus Kaiserbacteria bacterium RIFCSPLOWO2_12_FULL_45_26]
MNQVLEKFIRAADYLSAVQIYLRGNYLLNEPLKREHIKPRLLGHWGTCPGVNFTYAHLNRAIIEHDLDMMFVLGPGHGFPAVQSNLFLEGTLSKYYKNISRDKDGIADMARLFSWPYGFPSHSNPEAPGVILEGGELGYALATSYGAILDNPSLIVSCLIGDGEAETGPTATAWHLSKLIDPGRNGAVLPILHLNGYKISGPTLYGRMRDDELKSLFWGYGYDPIFVNAYEGEDVHDQMRAALDKAVNDIRFTQHCAREMTLKDNPRWPMIILRSPKGWHSIKQIREKRIEDNHYSHQVIAEGAAHNDEEFQLLEEWLRSYRFEELFDGEKFDADIESLVPRPDRRMGDNPRAHGGSTYRALNLPDLNNYSTSTTCNLDDPICGEVSSMEKIGEYLRDIMRMNEGERNIRLFSPDETYSNKLQAVFEYTKRTFVWPHKEWDKDLAWDGRVMEMLSEHSLQGMIQGYVLTGRHGVFVSYEAFVQIVASMADQYAKFLKVARSVPWRGVIPSLNYILTSTGWRQEHNGFSHQNPGFIDGVLQRQGCFTNVYFPADANIALATFHKMMSSTREINVMVCEKRPLPIWRSLEEAKIDVRDGLSIWNFASDEDPHVVIASAGDYPTQEALAAVSIIRQELPELRVRFVNITSLSALGMGNSGCRVLAHNFSEYFTEDKPIIVNFHGYPQTMKQVLFDYGCDSDRVSIHGYEEVGSTTTAFDMMVRNHVDRYHLAMQAFAFAEKTGVIDEDTLLRLTSLLQEELDKHREYIMKNGDDPIEITNWVWHSR